MAVVQERKHGDVPHRSPLFESLLLFRFPVKLEDSSFNFCVRSCDIHLAEEPEDLALGINNN
jgi:hypothetical protein